MSSSPPHKCILSKEQLEAFQNSSTHSAVISYIENFNDSVVGVKLTDECEESEVRWTEAISRTGCSLLVFCLA